MVRIKSGLIFIISFIGFGVSAVSIISDGQRAHLSALALPCAMIVGCIFIADAIYNKK